MHPEPESAGGQGGIPPTRSDLILYRRAVGPTAGDRRRRGWDVPAEDRPRIYQTVLDILRFCPDERTRLGAAKVVLAMDAADRADEALDLARAVLALRREEAEARRPPEQGGAAPIDFDAALEKVYGEKAPMPAPEPATAEADR